MMFVNFYQLGQDPLIVKVKRCNLRGLQGEQFQRVVTAETFSFVFQQKPDSNYYSDQTWHNGVIIKASSPH